MAKPKYSLDARGRLELTKKILARHFPDRDYPSGLVEDLFKALGEAELRGFQDCISCFDDAKSAANDA